MPHADPRAQRVIDFFERLAPADLTRLPELYTADAHFKDPFNNVRGVPAIERIFGHMFTTLEAPRFIVLDALVDGDQAFLTWDFVFRIQRLGPREQRVHGGTHLRFAADGRIALHRDYWDAAEELYEKLPLVGAVTRWLKRRMGA
jgi:ketosteroid isomerase-like protein